MPEGHAVIARHQHPKPLSYVGQEHESGDNFGSMPSNGEHVGLIGSLHFGAELVTLDLWVEGGPPYTKARFQFGADSENFKSLVAGAPPCSGPVTMGRGYSYDFNLMEVHYRTESAAPVNGYVRASLVELKLIPWPLSLRHVATKSLKTT